MELPEAGFVAFYTNKPTPSNLSIQHSGSFIFHTGKANFLLNNTPHSLNKTKRLAGLVGFKIIGSMWHLRLGHPLDFVFWRLVSQQ
jgi:hypothetical protein